MELNQFNYSRKSHQIFYFFLCSDLHIGNADCEMELLKEDFEKAINLNAKIFINGDVMEMIVPKDKRYTAGKDNHHLDAYVNEQVDCAYEFLKPYSKNILGIGTGNHEATVIKNSGTDPTDLLLKLLNLKKKNNLIRHLGYTGFLRFIYKYVRTIYTFDIFYNHGQGGSAPVTKGAIDLERRSYVATNLIWLGHKHTRIVHDMNPSIGVSAGNKIFEKRKVGVITGSYCKNIKRYNIKKKKYILDYGEERMRVPQSKRGVFLKINFYSKRVFDFEIVF